MAARTVTPTSQAVRAELAVELMPEAMAKDGVWMIVEPFAHDDL
jgi:hypothetical protein